MSESSEAVRAQAQLHHAWFLGLQLMVSAQKGPEVMYDWMFRLFRRQHLAKFLSSFEKLGLSDLPHAVACAQYHVLSNSVGGVGVEYVPESDRKAWVRFRYPRWMYHGPTLCGLPVEVSRGFLRGWYAHNGVSLGNPNLGYVCVSEDLTGQFGLCGYFVEEDRPLAEEERLRFAPDELPPDFTLHPQPALPSAEWSEERLQKANRNYAMEYLRNGMAELAAVIGVEETRAIGRKSARLIGLQYRAETAEMLGIPDGGLDDAARYLTRMFEGMGDAVTSRNDGNRMRLRHEGLRIVRDLPEAERALLLECWCELYAGAMASERSMKQLDVQIASDGLDWTLGPWATR